MKQDITEFSDSELFLIVMNDEYYYRRRHRSNLREELTEHFIFTDEQWDELAQDLQEEEND